MRDIFTLGDKVHPWGPTSLLGPTSFLGANFIPGGQLHSRGSNFAPWGETKAGLRPRRTGCFTPGYCNIGPWPQTSTNWLKAAKGRLETAAMSQLAAITAVGNRWRQSLPAVPFPVSEAA
jgi:hypothetical protein